MLQLHENLLDLIKAQRASKAQNRLYAISDLRGQERVCGRRLVGMTVCDEWTWCGVDVVYGVYEVCGECVVSVQFVWCVR